jgi:lipopolysaccharide export system protein LptA
MGKLLNLQPGLVALGVAVSTVANGELGAQTLDAATIQESVSSRQNANIEADSMEILEAEKKAIFSGNVSAERTGTRLSSDKMVVTYADELQPDGSKKTDVTHIDAKGNVEIKTARQTITGEHALLDVKSDELTVTGNVVVREGNTVIRGEKLKADLKSKTSSMTGGRVKGSFVPRTSSN